MKKHCLRPLYVITVISLLLLPLLSQCSSSDKILPTENAQDAAPILVENTAKPNIEIKFTVQMPESEETSQIFLDVLDEVTGLTFNAHRYLMNKIDTQHYEIRIPFIEGSLVKYRYSHDETNPVIERTPAGGQVRYRMYYAKNPGEVTDIVSSWTQGTFTGKTGRIEGKIVDTSGTPLSDILVTAGGLSAISAADGSYFLEGVQTGLHNLAVTSITGDYLPYQQGAVVEDRAITPAQLTLEKAEHVNVTFVINQPEGYQDGNPVRLIGNLYETGNTLSDLKGGMSISAARAPQLSRLSDGRYATTLELPTGADLRYKYSLGDGFWNGELDAKDSYYVRQLIIPNTDCIVADKIEKWQTQKFQPVSFELTVPEFTPTSDTVSIQFFPNVWTEPIPMWRNGDNQWKFILYNPLNLLSKISYRYCRNGQCETAAATEITGSQNGFELDVNNLPAKVEDTIKDWAWLDKTDDALSVVGAEVNPRGESFMAGVELLDYYDPTMQANFTNSFQNIYAMGANWTIVTPTWHFRTTNPPVLEQIPGKDPLEADLSGMFQAAKNFNLQIALFPQSITGDNQLKWWMEAERDSVWWQVWFDRYKTFLLHNAIIAQKYGINALILGGPGMWPAMPNGKMPDGNPSEVFGDAETRWKLIIDEVRSSYSGELILAIENPASLSVSAEFLSKFDKIYVLIDAPLSTNKAYGQDLATPIKNILDDQILPFQQAIQKPVIIGIKYPSHPDAVRGCVEIGDRCQSFEILDQPVSSPQEIETDLNIQYKIYEAFLNAVNKREWITGFVSRGYNSPVGLQDFSSSVRGKPATALLWYWFPRFISSVQ